MATVSQVGTFKSGTYGFPVNISLAATPISLAGATAVHLDVKRPSEDPSPGIAFRDLTLSSITDAVNGVITWTVLNGDLTVLGNYSLTLTIDFGVNMRLVVDATMMVS